MASSLQQLIDIGHPLPSASQFDWGSVEDRLRAPVPPDYRELLNAGGGGLWLGYIRLFVPGAGSMSGLDLAESGLEFEQLQELWEDEVIGRPGDLASDTRLLPWASTGAGVTFYWQVSGTPSAYPIRVSDPDGVEWARYDLLTTDLLLGIVRGEIRDAVGALPADCPGIGLHNDAVADTRGNTARYVHGELYPVHVRIPRVRHELGAAGDDERVRIPRTTRYPRMRDHRRLAIEVGQRIRHEHRRHPGLRRRDTAAEEHTTGRWPATDPHHTAVLGATPDLTCSGIGDQVVKPAFGEHG